MAQQVTKRYRLKKDLNLPMKSVKAGTLSNDSKYIDVVIFGSGDNSFAFTLEEITRYPDWFEEVKDAPFECYWSYVNKNYEEGFLSQLVHVKGIPEKHWDKIRKAIEDIVNGVDNAPDIDQLQREAFEAGREWEMNIINGYNGIGGAYSTLKYTKFEDYKNSKK